MPLVHFISVHTAQTVMIILATCIYEQIDSREVGMVALAVWMFHVQTT